MQPCSQQRVVITGVGGWSCLGTTFAASWESLLARTDCPAEQVKRFDASSFPTSIACEAAERGEDRDPGMVALAVAAAQEALASSKLRPLDVEERGGQWFLGLGMGTPDLDWYRDVVLKDVRDPSVYQLQIEQLPAWVGQKIAQRTGCDVPVQVVHTACASSAQVVGEAFLALRAGEFDLCLAGGSDAMVQPFQLAGFSLLGALSQENDHPAKSSRPFSRRRDGLVIGEGSCVLVMETLPAAIERQAPILAEVVGYGCTESAYRITDLHPEGRGVRQAIEAAVEMAAIEVGQVDYINAHGTSTIPNDQIESTVIADQFSNRTQVSSTKAMVGHMIAAAGAFEAGICSYVLSQQKLPQSLFRDDQDPRCQVRLTPDVATSAKLEYVLSNSIGFGGSNAALILKRWSQDA